nr:GGDEF domain-containing protein [Motiliproteus sp. SC1-56]
MRLYRQANRDPLTGLANRRSLMTFLKREAEHCQSQEVALSVMLFDLDKFKRVNDQYGHAVGDKVLKAFSKLAVEQSRQEDLVGRFGGEEFLMILHNTPLAGAQRIGERLRQACMNESIEVEGGEPFSFTTSIGIAQLQPEESLEQLLKRVDEALYAAKRGGRNRIALA